MPVHRPTLPGTTPFPLTQALRRLQDAVDAHEVVLSALPTTAGEPVDLAVIQKALSASGATPLQITDLLGNSGAASGQVIVGTHDERLAMTLPEEGSVFLETDEFRKAIYVVTNSQWEFFGNFSVKGGSFPGDQPTDLTATDGDFIFFAKDQGFLQRWSGATWHYHTGYLIADIADRPTLADDVVDTGFVFIAQDLGYQMWVMKGDWIFIGGGQPLEVTSGTLPAGLSALDEGVLVYNTDFNRVYRWDGAAWEDAPGEDDRGYVTWFDLTPDHNGWQICDGSTVNRSTSTGGEVAVTVPDLIGLNAIIRSNNASGDPSIQLADGADRNLYDLVPYYRL